MLLILGKTVFNNDLINGIGCITNLSFSVYRLSHKFEYKSIFYNIMCYQISGSKDYRKNNSHFCKSSCLLE